MASAPFSTALKTRRLDPVSHSEWRTEWRIADPAEAVLTNLRLINVRQTEDFPVHRTLGLLSLIRHVRLEANGRELDSQRFYNRLACFREGLQDANDEQVSMQRALTGSNNGFDILVTNDAGANQMNWPRIGDSGPAALSADNADVTVELRNILGFLRATPLLHPAALGELRLIIEWENEIGVGLPTGGPSNIGAPQLVMTYSRDPSMIEDAVRTLSQPVTFSTWFHDQFYVPPPDADAVAAGGTAVQLTPAVTRAFDGHYVQRLLQMNEPQSNIEALSVSYGRLQSAARYKGVDRVYINGRPEFGAYGIDSPARRATILHDAFEGSHTHLPGQEITGTTYDPSMLTHEGLVGTQEWTGYVVGRHIAQLALEWQRTIVGLAGLVPGNTRVNQAVIVRLFGEVYRTRMPNGTVVALATQ
jgi:hypothetical protein